MTDKVIAMRDHNVKHFTRPVPSEIASPSQSAKALYFKDAESLEARQFLLTISSSRVKKKSRAFQKGSHESTHS